MKEAPKIINKLAFIYLITLCIPLLLELDKGLFPKALKITPYVDPAKNGPLVVDGIEVESGLIYDDGYLLVKEQCIQCHSLELVTQNHASRDGWLDNIRWMQETQGLWDLGELEGPILDYLAKNYGPRKSSRRANLENIDWHDYKD